MAKSKRYKEYFDIDPKYYAAVTADLIKQGEVKWESFYPHETFVNLLEKTHKVISGHTPLSLWVEGAYGTGKSHAALTIKSLLEASDAEVAAYFDDYGLSKDLCQKLIADKNGGKLITVHRIGSSDIHSDRELAIAVQNSVMDALDEHGIANRGEASLRGATLEWLKKPANREYFAKLISEEKYAWNFNGKDVDEVIEVLLNASDDEVSEMMKNILAVAEDNGITAIKLDIDVLVNWIKSVIAENKLSAVLFIWDEFTEYFQNNQNSLTGFQKLIEISESRPFYFMIVSHESRSLFANTETAKKILDRFVPPIRIELPENMAFKLMAQAMKITSDPVLSNEWTNEFAADLNEQLSEVRSDIASSSKVQISDEELKKIVPIHPYAALLLKHISVAFNSNQRSMFDFIINNDVDESKGFKWFIEEHGPLDPEYNILTVDMLWDFFYGKGKSGLNDDVRVILDTFNLLQTDKISPEEQRVLKTILLLQAISLRVSDVELLKPTVRNIDLAFCGTDWSKGKASSIADKLEKEGLVFKKQTGGGGFEYTVAMSAGDTSAIERIKQDVSTKTKTQDLITDGQLADSLLLPGSIKEYFAVRYASAASFNSELGKLLSDYSREFRVLVAFARNDDEASSIKNLILQASAKHSDLIFIDASTTPLGKDLFDQYVENRAYCSYYAKSDRQHAQSFERAAGEILAEWKERISEGAFYLYGEQWPSGQREASFSILVEDLKKICKIRFPYGLISASVTEVMYRSQQMPQGAQCGILQKLEGPYKSANQATSLENVLKNAWKIDQYWKGPKNQNDPIVQIKIKVEELVSQGFDSSGRLAISEIVSALAGEPFGLLPSNLTAFVLGFALKEYCDPNYYWSNGASSEPMSIDKMKVMISDALKHQVNPNGRWKEQYIVAMSDEMKAFLIGTASIFGLDKQQCTSLEITRDRMRTAMKALAFPIWFLKSIPEIASLTTSRDVLCNVIDSYCGIANIGRASGTTTEADLAKRIGQLLIDNPSAQDDLSSLVTSPNCQNGLREYLKEYRGGRLIELAENVGDPGVYIDEIKSKFNADAANWVWAEKTAEEKIDEVILEYGIIEESNQIITPTKSFSACITGWYKAAGNIKIAQEVASSFYPDLAELLSILFSIKRGGGFLQESLREKFYEQLRLHGSEFHSFYISQKVCFLSVADSLLNGLSEDDKTKILSQLDSDQFMKSSGEFFRDLENEISGYVKNLAKTQLTSLWKEKTGTDSPFDWSRQYLTPITCMFDSANRQLFVKHMKAFGSYAAGEDVSAAIEYLKDLDLDYLADEKKRDECFMRHVVGDFCVLIPDPNYVRDELLSLQGIYPNQWLDNSVVREKLRSLADKKYKTTGSDQALGLIEAMEPEELKKYLKRLVAGNMTVGMEIIRNSRDD